MTTLPTILRLTKGRRPGLGRPSRRSLVRKTLPTILSRVSTQKNQLLQNQLFGDLVCTPTYKNLLVQISHSKTSSILQKTALNSDRNQLLTSHSIFLLERISCTTSKVLQGCWPFQREVNGSTTLNNYF